MRTTTLCVLALITAVLDGCTGSYDVAPTLPATTESITTLEAPRPSEVPPIEATVDLTPFHRQTCSLLTPEQTAVLRLPPQDIDGADPETGLCLWDTVPPGDAIYALTVFITGDPLGDAYQRSNARFDSGRFVWRPFEVRTIGGLPAVVQAMGDTSIYCEVVVGTGGGQGILLTASVRFERANPALCDRIVTAAEWVIEAARAQ